MTREHAKEIAEYVFPRLIRFLEEKFPELFSHLTKDEKLRFFRENWDALIEQTAGNVHWIAVGIEEREKNRYM